MRNVWIVRHGERIDKVDPRWALAPPRGAWDDPPLTSRGLKQAHEVGHRLARESPIDYIFVSPFIRCLQTATNIVAELRNKKDLKLFIEPGFIESLSCTQFPPGCLSAEQLKEFFPLVDTTYRPFLTKFDPEENDLECDKRIQATLEAVFERYPIPKNILIVSHGSPIAAMHTVLNRKYKYVGICTISHYIMQESGSESPSNRENKRQIEKSNLHTKYAIKCMLAGDSSHLSDRNNLRDNY